MTARTVHIDPDLDLQIDEQGSGRRVLVIHGGGGPATVATIAAHVASSARALTPTLPGWNGTARPDRIARVEDIAAALSKWLFQADLDDVAVIGSSIGGWIAAEMAVSDVARGRISRIALLDAVGFEVGGHPVRDFFALDARGVAEYTFHDSERFYVDPATVPADRREVQVANMATLRTVAGDPYMVDPLLLERVAAVEIPVLALWGDSDGIADPGYGRAVADSFPHAHFELVREAGHLPHLEQPAEVFSILDRFLVAQD